MLSNPGDQPVMQAFSLKGRVAIVTGGNRGIGLDVTNGLAEAGADIAIVYRSSKGAAEEVAERISKNHQVKVLAYQADVADAAVMDATVARTVADFGRLDIMVANAGVGAEFDAIDCKPAQFREQMAVNLDGAFYCAQAAAKVFKAQGSGNVIFTTSMSGLIVNRPEPQAVYNASKAGLIHLAKSLAVEWVSFCRVNCISPGYIATEMISEVPEDWKKSWIANSPSGRFGETYELKGAYVFCASDASSFMTGANIVIDGGFSLP